MADQKMPTRHWREIAADIFKEQGSESRSKLIRELDRSLSEEDQKGRKTLLVNPGLAVRGRKPLKG